MGRFPTDQCPGRYLGATRRGSARAPAHPDPFLARRGRPATPRRSAPGPAASAAATRCLVDRHAATLRSPVAPRRSRRTCPSGRGTARTPPPGPHRVEGEAVRVSAWSVASVAGSRIGSREKAASEAATTRRAASSPWTRAVTSNASARCAARPPAARPAPPRAPRSRRAKQREEAQQPARFGVVAGRASTGRTRTAMFAPDRARPTSRPRSCRTSRRPGPAAVRTRARGPGPRLPRRPRSGGSARGPAVMLPHWSAPPDLELHAHRPVQVPVVGGLQEHVAELGEREPAPHPPLDRVLGEHVRDREVLPDVAQEVEHRDLAQPVEVVHHGRRRWARRSPGSAPAAVGSPATFASSVSRSSRFRSADVPDGSPIIPVAPPTSTIGLPPRRWRWMRPMTGTRWPTWSEGPDGSKPL